MTTLARPLGFAMCLLACLAGSRRVAAHHVVHDSGLTPVLPRSIVAWDLAAATFNVSGTTGTWQTTALLAEWRLAGRLSITGVVPLARVAADARPVATGLADVSLAAKLTVYSSPERRLVLVLGGGIELPTGDHQRGLGGGHVGLSPFAAGLWTPHRGDLSWILYGVAAPQIALGGHHDGSGGVHGSFIAPHAQRELYGRAVTALAADYGHVGFGVEGSASADAGYGAVRAEIGLSVTDVIRTLIAVERSLLGDQRYGTRSRLTFVWKFE